MSRHLDRLFTQAFKGEEAKAPPGPRRPDAAATSAAAAAAAEEAADPSEPARILAAAKRKDYAACLGLPPVTLDALGRPEWPVTDRHAPELRTPRRRSERAERGAAPCLKRELAPPTRAYRPPRLYALTRASAFALFAAAAR